MSLSAPETHGRGAGVRRAVIDIGTNAVKVLVGRVTPDGVAPIAERNEQTRLGRGFYRDQRLLPEAMEATTRAVAGFVRFAREQGAESVRVLATSAVREARNADVLLDGINRETGLSVEVISGDTEARLTFQGVMRCPGIGEGPVLILDAGGGSTEFIIGNGGECLFRKSYRLGAVRMLEGSNHPDPPGAAARGDCLRETVAFLHNSVAPELEPFLRLARPRFLVGTGGSAAIIARIQLGLAEYDRDRIESARLSRAQVAGHVDKLWNTPLADRRRVPGLPSDRADIILMGAIIYEAVMEGFQFEELRVSTRGLRFAALMEGF